MINVSRGDVVLVAFPFVTQSHAQRKRRPALVVQANRYNRRRAAVIIAAITSTRAHEQLPCKVPVAKDSWEGREAGLRLIAAKLISNPLISLSLRTSQIPSGYDGHPPRSTAATSSETVDNGLQSHVSRGFCKSSQIKDLAFARN